MNNNLPEIKRPEDALTEGEEMFMRDVTRAMNNLPIISRLEFAKNLIADHGGERDLLPQDAVLVAAAEILGEVIEVLRQHPRLARLRGNNPRM